MSLPRRQFLKDFERRLNRSAREQLLHKEIVLVPRDSRGLTRKLEFPIGS